MSIEREFLKKLRYATHLENDLRKELEELLAQPEKKQEIPYGIRKLLAFAGKNIRSPIRSERAPPHLYLTRRYCIEIGNYLKGL